MSFDIAVWDGARPVSDEDAAVQFAALADRFLEAEAQTEPTPAIAAFLRALVEVHPDDLPDERIDDECVWASMPIAGDASGPLAYLAIRWSRAEDVAATVSSLARARGLVCFDPQSSSLL